MWKPAKSGKGRGNISPTKEKILEPLYRCPGKIGFYYKNLTTGEEWELGSRQPLVAASVIKLPVLVEIFALLERGELRRDETFRLREEDKLPSCGALNCMHDGLQVTLQDLYTLMIVLSDNTAANMLIRRIGMDRVNGCMRRLGLRTTALNRLLFDDEASARGVQNIISAWEMGILLERMASGSLVSPEASAEMVGILENQRLNGKMPFYFTEEIRIAHKTGEDDGISHDVGIVFAPQPFVACFCSNETDVPQFETAIQKITRDLYKKQVNV